MEVVAFDSGSVSSPHARDAVLGIEGAIVEVAGVLALCASELCDLLKFEIAPVK